MNNHADAVGVRHTLAILHRSTGVPIMYGGVVERGRMRLTPPLGTHSSLLARLTVHSGRGLGGRTLVLGRPMAVKDYTDATTISHDYDDAVRDAGIRSAIAVPVVVRRTVRAVLYAARREPLPLGDRAVQAVVAAARDLEQEMVVRTEVDRQIAVLRQHGHDTAAAPESMARQSVAREAVRQAYAELRLLAARASDTEVRQRALRACAALTPALAEDQPEEEADAAAGRAALDGPAGGGASGAGIGGAGDPGAPGGDEFGGDGPGGPDAGRPGGGRWIDGSPPVQLAPRELDVLGCVALGYTNAEVAEEMAVGVETVKSYLRSAMRKLHAHTRTQAVAAARRAGLMP